MASTSSTLSSEPQQQQQTPQLPAHHTESLDHCIRHRHSIRSYLPDPVPLPLLHRCLSLAQLSPSNSNIQPWRLYLATSSRRNRIVTSLLSAASTSPTTSIPPLPDAYKHFRSELGHEIYGPHGYDVPRNDSVAHEAAVRRNFEFFGAPVVAVLCCDERLADVDLACCGMFLQTFMLALTEEGVGSCVEVSVTGYESVLREGFGVREGEKVLCGVAIGWPDPSSQVNKVVIGREAVEKNVTFLTDE